MAQARSDYCILLVEDTPEMAQLTMLTLKRIGFTANHIDDGLKAVEFLQAQRPDLILLDLNLPGLSGWQVMEHLVEIYGANSVPVIVTSAMGDSANRVIGKLQDVFQYLVKPFPPSALMQAVEKALNIDD